MHPINKVRKFLNEQYNTDKYSSVGRAAGEKYRTELQDVDPYERIEQLIARSARLQDKLNLAKELVAMSIGFRDTLSDDDLFTILAARVVAEGKPHLWEGTEE